MICLISKNMTTKCYIQDKHFRFKDTNRLKAKTYLNRNQRGERERELEWLPDKIDFKKDVDTRHKKVAL